MIAFFPLVTKKDGDDWQTLPSSKDKREEIKSYGFKNTVVFEFSVLKMVYCFNDLCCHLHCKF